MNTQPVLVLTAVAVLTGAAAALQLLATDHTLPGILAALAAGIIAALGFVTKNMVTPLVDPKDNEGNHLVPEPPVYGPPEV